MGKGKLMLLGGCGLGGLLLFGAVFAWIVSGEDYGTDRQLDLAMHLMEEGRWDQANFIAREIEERGELTPAREPVWNYIRGVAGVYKAKDKLHSPAHRRELWESTEFLEKCREQGFPLAIAGKAITIWASVTSILMPGTRLSNRSTPWSMFGLSIAAMRST